MLLTYLYLLRVPLAGGLALAALAPLALMKGSRATTLLEGMFDLEPAQRVVVTLAALFCASSSIVTTELVLRYGALRCGVPRLPSWLEHVVARPLRLNLTVASVINVATHILCAVVLLGGLFWAGRAQPWSTIGSLAGGVAAFIAFAVFVAWLWASSPPAAARFAARVFLWTPDGYIQTPLQKAMSLVAVPRAAARHASHELLLPGHAFAALATSATLVVYAAFGIVNGPWRSGPVVPSLACVLFLLVLLIYVLAGLAFLLDRFRVPFALPLILLLLASADWPQADHYFYVQSVPRPARLRPAEVLATHRQRAIAVAASGGGSQAAAWMTSVLSQLNDASHGKLAPAMCVISGVSGGSTGAMYFLDAYEGSGEVPLRNRTIFERASRSSLDEVAWGFVYPDFLRLAVPFAIHTDRAMALEQAWTQAGAPTALLSSWREPTRQGHRPAVIFNATLVETGGRLLISTTDLPQVPRGRKDFYETFNNADVRVVTAARLSATFPYVLPAARIQADVPVGDAYHVVDGGYYDAFGVASLADWLSEAIPTSGATVTRLLVLRILGPESPDDAPSTGHRGFLFQVAAPLQGLLSFRTTGQLSRNDTALALLAQAMRRRGVQIECATFQYPLPDAPLSWHLTSDEREATWRLYNDAALASARQQVLEFLQDPESNTHGADAGCGAAPDRG